MTPVVYTVHRAIGRPVTFKGFQGQYILIAAGAIMADLFLFVILYCLRVTPWACTLIAVGLGAASLSGIGRISRKYGTHGLMKKYARRKTPRGIAFTSRLPFTHLDKCICPNN